MICIPVRCISGSNRHVLPHRSATLPKLIPSYSSWVQFLLTLVSTRLTAENTDCPTRRNTDRFGNIAWGINNKKKSVKVGVFVPRSRFSITCEDFDVFRSTDDVILLIARNVPLGRPHFPTMPFHLGESLYRLQIKHKSSTVCDLPVRVEWVRHPLEPEPFLAVRRDDHHALWACLKAVEGQTVEITFTPIKNEKVRLVFVPVLANGALEATELSLASETMSNWVGPVFVADMTEAVMLFIVAMPVAYHSLAALVI
jgi:hypothetical protein